MSVDYEGESYALCPYFPGYSFCWTSLDDILADNIIAFLEFMDRFAPKADEKPVVVNAATESQPDSACGHAKAQG